MNVFAAQMIETVGVADTIILHFAFSILHLIYLCIIPKLWQKVNCMFSRIWGKTVLAHDKNPLKQQFLKIFLEKPLSKTEKHTIVLKVINVTAF